MSASPAQRAMINNLLDERNAPPDARALARQLLDDPTASPARGGPISQLIDGLLKIPRPSTPSAPRHPGRGPVNASLRDAEVPCSMYAIPVSALHPALFATYAPDNDHLFVVVGEFKDTRYVKQLHGSPGSFSRTAFDSVPERLEVVRALAAAPPLAAAQLFGTLYTCCGSCGAPLTDPLSRLHRLGPDCRRKFGL